MTRKAVLFGLFVALANKGPGAMSTETLSKTVPPVQSEASLSKGQRTRERLFEIAFESVIAKGFAATSIEELVAEAGITKSGFFYHFKDKGDLAHQMLDRYFAETDGMLDALEARARELSDDPLHAYLVYLKLYAETMTELVAAVPGCIVATITFQERAFERRIGEMNAAGIASWCARGKVWLRDIIEVYPPKHPISVDDLADSQLSLTIGAIALSKASRDPQAVGRHVMQYRDYIRLLFQP
jgi:TetR/AcrR family transcriptional regulator, transcriptional repressor for nem operon